MSNRDVVFVDGVRTAFGTMGRTLRNFTMEQLGGLAIKGLLAKTKIIEKGGRVDSVFAGSAIGGTSALNPARWVSLAGGLPESTAASYVEMQCGSAIDSINHAAWRIIAGQADIMIAGGRHGVLQPGLRQILHVHRTLQNDSPVSNRPVPLPYPRPGNLEHGADGGSPAEDVRHFPPGPG